MSKRAKKAKVSEFLTPRVPTSANDSENAEIERVCFSTSIDGCLSALQCDAGVYQIYCLDDSKISKIQDFRIYRPNKQECFDHVETGERWVLGHKIPVRFLGFAVVTSEDAKNVMRQIYTSKYPPYSYYVHFTSWKYAESF